MSHGSNADGAGASTRSSSGGTTQAHATAASRLISPNWIAHALPKASRSASSSNSSGAPSASGTSNSAAVRGVKRNTRSPTHSSAKQTGQAHNSPESGTTNPLEVV